MRDQPQGSVFGGYGFMRYSAPQNPQHLQRQSGEANTGSGFGIAAVAQWFRACWTRR